MKIWLTIRTNGVTAKKLVLLDYCCCVLKTMDCKINCVKQNHSYSCTQTYTDADFTAACAHVIRIHYTNTTPVFTLGICTWDVSSGCYLYRSVRFLILHQHLIFPLFFFSYSPLSIFLRATSLWRRSVSKGTTSGFVTLHLPKCTTITAFLFPLCLTATCRRKRLILTACTAPTCITTNTDKHTQRHSYSLWTLTPRISNNTSTTSC